MPKQGYDFIIIGSGVAGLSCALHLANRGQRVIVLEQHTLASGATSRASGLIGQMRSSQDATRLVMNSLRYIREVEARTDTRVFHETGSIRIAQTEARAEELANDLATAKAAGLKCETVDRVWLAERMPFVRSDDIIQAAFCPSDGYLNPPELAQAYINLAKSRGITFQERCRVKEILLKNGKVTGVRTDAKIVTTPNVINAAGPWGRLIADLVEQPLPTAGVVHRYFTSNTEYPPTAPTLRDRELRIYARPKDGKLRVGIYERTPEGFDMAAAGSAFKMESMNTDANHPTVQALFEATKQRFPAFDATEPIELIAGVMAFSPDGNSLIGTFPEIEGLHHVTGLCGHGVAQSGEIGAIAAGLILENTCRYNLSELRADRFADFPEYHDPAHTQSACEQAYAAYYGK